MPNNGQSNFEREWSKAQDYVREYNAQRRAEEAARRREDGARKRAAKRESDKRSKELPWICRFDNALHDFLGQPRNY